MKKFIFFASLIIFFIFYSQWPDFYYKIPMQLDCHSGCPVILAQIEGNSYPLELDLGSKMPLSLQARVLKKLQKEQKEMSRRLDFKGNKYETPGYIIPRVSLEDFSVSKVKAQEESFAFVANSLLHSNTGETEEEFVFRYFGRLGLDFFKEQNFLLDFSRPWLIICKNLQKLSKEGYDLKRFIKGSFSLTVCGIVLTVETDLGPMRMMLDTASTDTLVRSSFLKSAPPEEKCSGLPLISTSKFVINGIDFGSFPILVMDFTPRVDEFIDGVLGVNFLKNHPIFFDFKKHVFYIYY